MPKDLTWGFCHLPLALRAPCGVISDCGLAALVLMGPNCELREGGGAVKLGLWDAVRPNGMDLCLPLLLLMPSKEAVEVVRVFSR